MSEVVKSESVILCEGYHDRAFWAGWLVKIGCQDLRPKPGENVLDPWNKAVKRGQYAYRSKSGGFIRVVPVLGDSKLVDVAKELLVNRVTRPLVRLVLNLDPDTVAGDPHQRTTGLRVQNVLTALKETEETATINADQEIELDEGATKVTLIRWETTEAKAPGLPRQQTLERLVCASLCAAYPKRGDNVQNWLDSRHEPPLRTTGKHYAWSYYAGWLAEHGTEDFYRCLWDDPKVASELETRRRASGAWRVAEALAS